MDNFLNDLEKQIVNRALERQRNIQNGYGMTEREYRARLASDPRRTLTGNYYDIPVSNASLEDLSKMLYRTPMEERVINEMSGINSDGSYNDVAQARALSEMTIQDILKAGLLREYINNLNSLR